MTFTWISLKPAIFLFPVYFIYYLIYWSTKIHHTFCPSCYFHKVSIKFEVDTTIHYLVIAVLLLKRYVTLTFWLWEYITGHVVNLSTYPFLSYDLWRVPLVNTDNVFAATDMWQAMSPIYRTKIFSAHFKSPTAVCLFTLQLSGSMMTINWVICENSLWPCVEGHTAVSPCAKSHDLGIRSQKQLHIGNPNPIWLFTT